MIFDKKKTGRTVSDFDWKISMEFRNFSHWFLLPNIKLVWGREKRVNFFSFHFCLKIFTWLCPKCTCRANQNTLHGANQNIHFRTTDHTALERLEVNIISRQFLIFNSQYTQMLFPKVNDGVVTDFRIVNWSFLKIRKNLRFHWQNCWRLDGKSKLESIYTV
jgi:hypothetical protein